ncbi:MAG: response regulator transcription factor [Candidatus Odinarchaeota archaeon]
MEAVLHVAGEKDFSDTGKFFLKRTASNVENDRFSRTSEALELVEKHSHRVTFSDHQMQDKNRLDFLKELKARGSFIPFIMLTNDGNGELRMLVSNLEAEYFIQKSGNQVPMFAELCQVVLELLLKKTGEQHGAQDFHIPLEKTGRQSLATG